MIKNLVLAGCGHMGRAMLWPWLSTKAAEKIYVVDPNAESFQRVQGVWQATSVDNLPKDLAPDMVVFAVKPQVLDVVVEDYKRFPRALFLSIAAGKKLSVYERILGKDARIIRGMPNLAAKVGEAATLLVANTNTSPVDKTIAEKLFNLLGASYWLDSEDKMDAATALSGCGPGYFYLMGDLLAQVGKELGLPGDLAAKLARQTLIGSALFAKTEEESLENLYQDVAVKGGMTEAAIDTLKENDALKTLLAKALQAAVDRGRKLAS